MMKRNGLLIGTRAYYVVQDLIGANMAHISAGSYEYRVRVTRRKCITVTVHFRAGTEWGYDASAECARLCLSGMNQPHIGRYGNLITMVIPL